MEELSALFKFLSGIFGVVIAYLTYLTYRRSTKIKELEDEIYHLKRINLQITSKVNPESDRRLISEAGKTIQIMGINALAPLHHCREELIDFLKNKKGSIQILLLDPSKEWFQKRAGKEGDIVGRLKSEWIASIKIIKDISQIAEDHGKIELKLYNTEPTRALLIIDASEQEPYKSRMLINYYPLSPGTRGYEGGQFLAERSLISDQDSFERNLSYFSNLWAKSRSIDVNEINGE